MVGAGHSTAHRAPRQIIEEMRQKHEGGRALPPFGSHIRPFARRSQSALLTEPTVSTVQRRRGVPLTLTPSSTQCVSSPSTHAGTGHPICSPSHQLSSSFHTFTAPCATASNHNAWGQHGDRHSGAVRITYRCGHPLISWYPSSDAAGLTAGSNRHLVVGSCGK